MPEKKKTEKKNDLFDLTDDEIAIIWNLTQRPAFELTGAGIDAIAALRTKIRPRVEALPKSK